MEGAQGGNHLTVEDSQVRVSPQTEYKPAECLQLAEIEAGRGEISAAKTPDKSKRDEWSQGGVMSLLDVYESKWLLRNRAKLKGSDWEEIAQQVSVRSCGTKPVKTPNQCKNKIESMKKRYRAESVGTHNSNTGSSWQFYVRMDGLLRGISNSQCKVISGGCVNGVPELGAQTSPKVEMDDSGHVLKLVNEVVPATASAHHQNVEKTLNFETVDVEAEVHMHGSNQDDGSNTLPDHKEESKGTDSEVKFNPFKRRKSSTSEVAESIRFLAHSLLKIEQMRMEMYKDSERLRAEAEIRRGEMELKRAEIIAKSQLQIAELLSGRSRSQSNNSGSSSLRAEPKFPTNTEGRNG